MKSARAVRVLVASLIVGLGLAGCGSGETAHAEYFVVTFLAGTPAPSDQGVEALASAAQEAGRHKPTYIEIVAAQPAGSSPPALARQRIDAVKRALADAGVDERLVRITFRAYPDKEFNARKDSFLLDLAYGITP